MLRIPTHRPPAHPGEILLEEFLKPLEIPQVEFAKWLGISFQRLNGIIHGRRGVTPDTALRLERALGVSAATWLNLQTAWDLYHAQRSADSQAIGRIKRVPALRSA